MAVRVRRPQDEGAREAATFAATLGDDYLHCRELGHTWMPGSARYVREQRAYERVLRCPRCLTERVQVLTEYGGIVSNGYRYPEGYEHKGHGRMVGGARDALRLESLNRLLK